MEKITGKIKRIVQRPNNYGVLLEDHAVWFNDEGSCVASEGDNVLITFSMDGKGFMKIDNITKIGIAGYTEPTKEPTPEKKEMPFVPASEISTEDRVVGANAHILNRCYQEVEKILGRKPTTDGEIAMVNGLSISVQKHLNTSAILKIAEKLREKST